MTYVFQEVDIIAFDIHTTAKPVAFPQSVKDQFRFLASPNEYDKQYKTWKSAETDNLVIRPITKRELKRNHFWKHYAAMSSGIDTTYWELQIPFVIEPKHFDVKVNAEGLGFETRAAAVIYVNSLGWSTNVEIRLKGAISAAQLQDFVGRLRGIGASKAPFLVAGVEKGLIALFKLLGDLVREEIYSSPANLGDITSTPKHLMISLAKASGSAKYFRTEWGLNPAMADHERREMLSILYGSEVSNPKAIELLTKTESESDEEPAAKGGQPERVLVTRLRETDFAISSYKLGTLFFPQEQALTKPEKREAMACMLSNARSSTMMSLSMLGFNQAANKLVKSNKVIDSLQTHIKGVIRGLSDYYDNPYSRNWHDHHKQMQELRTADED